MGEQEYVGSPCTRVFKSWESRFKLLTLGVTQCKLVCIEDPSILPHARFQSTFKNAWQWSRFPHQRLDLFSTNIAARFMIRDISDKISV